MSTNPCSFAWSSAMSCRAFEVDSAQTMVARIDEFVLPYAQERLETSQWSLESSVAELLMPPPGHDSRWNRR
ncbi:hypothetical protein KSD_82020 [Ktedonobacter sp. SOSP1-85]|nr:hypothetical protein KSD_82020 [Ktedonobacter sp. SOSP1-85]